MHQLVNDDGLLKVLAVMQNSGLPEAGDGALTFPPDVLADRVRYAGGVTRPARRGTVRAGG